MKNRGFSLVEILVSISLIAILSVIGVTNYMGSLAKGEMPKEKRIWG
jgi:prepilin-type N-terminal cleavage/methylation domain-containing protein